MPSPLLLLQKGPPSNPGGGARGWALTCPQVTRGHVCRTEIFSGKSVAHEDIQYEQACILYNLGELPPARPRRDGPWAMQRRLSSASPSPPALFLGGRAPPAGRGCVGLLPLGSAGGMAAMASAGRPDPLWLWAASGRRQTRSGSAGSALHLMTQPQLGSRKKLPDWTSRLESTQEPLLRPLHPCMLQSRRREAWPDA